MTTAASHFVDQYQGVDLAASRLLAHVLDNGSLPWFDAYADWLTLIVQDTDNAPELPAEYHEGVELLGLDGVEEYAHAGKRLLARETINLASLVAHNRRYADRRPNGEAEMNELLDAIGKFWEWTREADAQMAEREQNQRVAEAKAGRR